MFLVYVRCKSYGMVYHSSLVPLPWYWYCCCDAPIILVLAVFFVFLHRDALGSLFCDHGRLTSIVLLFVFFMLFLWFMLRRGNYVRRYAHYLCDNARTFAPFFTVDLC